MLCSKDEKSKSDIAHCTSSCASQKQQLPLAVGSLKTLWRSSHSSATAMLRVDLASVMVQVDVVAGRHTFYDITFQRFGSCNQS